MGNVYVFNTTTQPLGLILNLMSLGNLSAAPTGSYTPTSMSVTRNNAPGNPGINQFGGQNTLVVTYGGGTPQQYTVNIDPVANPLSGDLQLYIFFNQVVLENQASGTASSGATNRVLMTSGQQLGTSEVFDGQPLSKEDVAKLAKIAKPQ